MKDYSTNGEKENGQKEKLNSRNSSNNKSKNSARNSSSNNNKYKNINKNSNIINDEHDKIFRIILTDKDEAVSLINKALKLKNESKLKPTDIELYETQYITKKLKNRRADVVYKIINNDKIKQGEVFIHIEHQSKQDKTMPYRIEEYEHEIKRIAMKNSLDGLMPKVYHILVYSGTGEWKVNNKRKNIESSLKEKVKEDAQYEVININSYSKEELEAEQRILPKVLLFETTKKTSKIVEQVSKIDLNKIPKEKVEMLIIYFSEVILKHTSEKNIKLIEKIMLKENDKMLALEKVFVKELEEKYNEGEIAGRKSGYSEGEIAGIKHRLTARKKRWQNHRL